MSTKVLLVDGVGNAVFYEREHDALTIEVNGVEFVKMRGHYDGYEFYRQAGCGPFRPIIRHVAHKLTSA